jgi:hypothetical protein
LGLGGYRPGGGGGRDVERGVTGNWPVLEAILRHRGQVQDREYGGIVSTLADAIERDGAPKIRLSGAIARHAEPTLADDEPAEPLYVEWNGLSRLLLARDGVPCAAYVVSDPDGPFAGALRFHFVAAINGVPLPFPAMPIVDVRPTGAQLSRVDRLRVRAGRPAAQDASRRQLAQMDRAVLDVDGYLVRVATGIGAKPLSLSRADKSGRWGTWSATDHRLETALMSTAVHRDLDNPMFAAERSDDVKTWSHRLAGFAIAYGPRAALELLSLVERQAKRN